jgi:hyperosmotically inducible periplasmic protein
MENRNRYHLPLVVLAAASFALTAAGCSDPDPHSASTRDKMETAVDKMEAKTDRATTKAAAAVDDAAITTKVKTALLAEPGLRSLKIDVDTTDAVVTLDGTVESSELKERAMQVAQTVGGVRSVVDHLVVKPA